MRRYDQTIRQLLGESPELVINNLIGTQFGKLRQTDHKMQMLLEREPDFLRLTEDVKGDPIVLHVEFQSGNDKEMPYRMLEYYAAAQRKFKQSVWQYVIYIGDRPLNMESGIRDRQNNFTYQVVDIRKIPFQVFLNSSNSALLPWAVLGDHSGKPSDEVITSVVSKIVSSTKGDKNLLTRQLTALAMFSSLRNLDQVTQQIIHNMPFDVDRIQNSYIGKLYRKEWTERTTKKIEKEYREKYQKEYQEKIILSKENMAKSMLQLGSISLQQISSITEIPEERLLELQSESAPDTKEARSLPKDPSCNS